VKVLLAALVVAALYLFCLKPNGKRRGEMAPFGARYIAHRGLFENGTAHPENSLPAFRRAVAAGYGIELDVQRTADGELVVFHDATLQRMCGDPRRLCDCTYGELQALSLLESGVSIPRFAEVLALVDGQVPLIVELKNGGDWLACARQSAQLLDGYRGDYCVESFHPLMLGWFRLHRPAVLRGQLATDFFREGADYHPLGMFLLSNLLLNCCSRPDFIAYCWRYADQPSYRLCRRLFPVVCAAWTVRSPQELAEASKTAQILIFDSFAPDKRPKPENDGKRPK
jgi:glycerophosphoryl diester phosphodiesterase